MNQPIPAKQLLIATLQQTKMNVTQLLMICSIFQLCAPTPMQELDPEKIADEMVKIAKEFGLTAEIKIDVFASTKSTRQNAHKN